MANNQGYQEFVKRLDEVCTQYADKVAIEYMRNDGSKTSFSFGEISEKIRTAKKLFDEVKLRPGDRVAIVAPLSPLALFVVIALGYSNITSVILDANLPQEEIDRLIENSDVRAIFTTPSLYGLLDEKLLKDIPVFDISKTSLEFGLFKDSQKQNTRSITSDADISVFTILFSSGTTDSMKGVMMTYISAIRTFEINIPLQRIDSTGSYLHVLPLNHIAGLVSVVAFFGGATIGMIEEADATKLKNALLDFEPTHFAMVPRVYEVMERKIKQEIISKGKIVSSIVFALIAISGFMRKIFGINLGKNIFKSVRNQIFGANFRVMVVGGSLCSESTAKFFLSLGVGMWANYYATTETNVPAVVTCAADRFPINTVGNVKRYDDIKIEILDPDENGIGEICVKTALIMKGYFRDPELTAAAFDEDGYFKTGDLGYIDKKGYLHVTGRIKEAIMLHTGKKVAPSDVDTLYSGICSPNIILASCGVPSRDESFDEIHMFIESGNLSPEEQEEAKKNILDFSAQTSTLYQIANVHFIEKIPTTSVGKVKRFQLREIALSERAEK